MVSKYDKFISNELKFDEGWAVLAIPIMGWFVAVLEFCFLLPIKYLYTRKKKCKTCINYKPRK